MDFCSFEVWKFEKRIWKEFKKKKKKTSSLSLSFLSNRPTPSFSPRFPRASGLFPFFPVRAQSAHSGPAASSADPTPRAPPFSFCAWGRQVGPGRQAFPLPPAAGQPRPLQGAGRYRPPPPRPSPSNTVIKPQWSPPFISPSSIDGYVDAKCALSANHTASRKA
jgi:hypothetical protein